MSAIPCEATGTHSGGVGHIIGSWTDTDGIRRVHIVHICAGHAEFYLTHVSSSPGGIALPGTTTYEAAIVGH